MPGNRLLTLLPDTTFNTHAILRTENFRPGRDSNPRPSGPVVNALNDWAAKAGKGARFVKLRTRIDELRIVRRRLYRYRHVDANGRVGTYENIDKGSFPLFYGTGEFLYFSQTDISTVKVATHTDNPTHSNACVSIVASRRRCEQTHIYTYIYRFVQTDISTFYDTHKVNSTHLTDISTRRYACCFYTHADFSTQEKLYSPREIDAVSAQGFFLFFYTYSRWQSDASICLRKLQLS